MSEVPTIFNGEMQLMNWGESSANGAWVKFWIAPDDLEAFRHLKCKSGKIAGHRVAAVLVEIGDDERPVQREEHQKGGALAALAGRLCADERFHEFVENTYGRVWTTTYPNEDIAQWMREQCGIDSRAELDHNEAAALKFHQIIRGPWQKYCQQKGWK